MLWQEDFSKSLSTMSQLFEYSVDISHKDGKVFLKADPRLEGGASAWFYVDMDDEKFSFTKEDVLELAVKVNKNKLRINYYYRKEGSAEYWGGEKIVSADEKIQTVRIPLKDAFPFYSGNFPQSLTPGKTPELYIFVDNLCPGQFDVEIDNIAVVKEKAGGEK
jgi:hypothetical protein